MADAATVIDMQARVAEIGIHDDILGYAIDLADAVEAEGHAALSVRYRNQFIRLAQAKAIQDARDFVAPEDLQAVFYPSLRHRMTRMDVSQRADAVRDIVARVPLP